MRDERDFTVLLRGLSVTSGAEDVVWVRAPDYPTALEEARLLAGAIGQGVRSVHSACLCPTCIAADTEAGDPFAEGGWRSGPPPF